MNLLRDDEWVTWSDSWLAELVGCKNLTVAAHRERLESTCQIGKLDQLLGKDGKWRPRKVEREKPPEVSDPRGERVRR